MVINEVKHFAFQQSPLFDVNRDLSKYAKDVGHMNYLKINEYLMNKEFLEKIKHFSDLQIRWICFLAIKQYSGDMDPLMNLKWVKDEWLKEHQKNIKK